MMSVPLFCLPTMAPRRNFRKTHRFLVPIAAVPLLLTALTGSLYPIFESFDLKADWLMQLHTGNFGLINPPIVLFQFAGCFDDHSGVFWSGASDQQPPRRWH